MAQGEIVVANMEKHENKQLPLCAVSMHAIKTSIENNERMKTARKVSMLAAVSTVK